MNFKIEKQYLHSNLRTEVWNSYQSGNFENAVLAAMRHVEISVREAAGLPNHLVGVSLMRKAFHPDDGALTDAAAHGGEKHAMADLFAGVIGSFRNPLAHRVVQFSEPDRATELILLANHLLLIVDLRKSTSP